MSARLEALQKLRQKIEGAYHSRDDYPPYKLLVWDDRAIYHHYILKLIDEEIEYESKLEEKP